MVAVRAVTGGLRPTSSSHYEFKVQRTHLESGEAKAQAEGTGV